MSFGDIENVLVFLLLLNYVSDVDTIVSPSFEMITHLHGLTNRKKKNIAVSLLQPQLCCRFTFTCRDHQK